MKLLIIGGTRFLGRALVETALQRGHTLTLFNRGQSNPDLFPEVEQLHGDRKTSLEPLAGRTWDAVIDTCGYEPAVVSASARMLANVVEHYTFVSSVSVYDGLGKSKVDETSYLAQLPPGVDPLAPFEMAHYGPLKALSEQAAEQAMPGRVFNLRPGLIVGPWDPTDRFTYWPVRVARGGEVLAPSRPDYPTEFIDVRDLSDWTVTMVEQRRTGPYNATGPRHPIPFSELLDLCRQASRSEARFTWVPEDFLLQQGIQPWSDLPLWIDETGPEGGIMETSIEKAVQEGLTFRPTLETVSDTLLWAKTRQPDHTWRAGLTPEREAEVLAAYHVR
jgi:2'-hydroxyisoflavone reductase